MSKIDKVYGQHAVQVLLKSQPQRILVLHVQQGRQDPRQQKLLASAQANGITVKTEPRKSLDDMVENNNHQGVVAECKPGASHDENYLYELAEKLGRDVFFLVLDGVTDPHNLGACLRTAEAAGVQAVIVPKDNSAGMNATVRKVASGAAELLPLIAVTNLARTLRQLQEAGVWVVGAAGETTQSVYDVDFKGPIAVVMGAEGDGMRRLTRECCDLLACIPMYGATESLNVSVATGVFLFEALRQREHSPRHAAK